MRAVDYERLWGHALKTLRGRFPEVELELLVCAEKIRFVRPLTWEKLVKEVRSLKPGWGMAQVAKLIPLLTVNRKPAGHIIALVSDFQRVEWQPVIASLRKAAGKKILYFQPEKLPSENLAVTRVQAEYHQFQHADRVDVTAQIRNFGLHTQTFILFVELGDTKQKLQETLRPGEHKSFHGSFPNPTGFSGKVWLQSGHAEAYTPDDTRFFVVKKPKPVRVQLLVSDPSDTLSRNDSFFLQKALSANRPPFRKLLVGQVGESSLTASRLQKTHTLILLSGVDAVKQTTLERIKAWLVAGGHLMILNGAEARQRLPAFNRSGIVHSRWEGYHGTPGGAYTTYVREIIRHPNILSPLVKEPADLFICPITSYNVLSPSPGSLVILRLATGDPFIIRESHERGTVDLFALNLDPRWSDLPLTQCFLPLLRLLIRSTLPNAEDTIQTVAGLRAVAEYPELGQHEVASDKGIAPGIYSTSQGPVCVNVGLVESELNYLPVQTLTGSAQIAPPSRVESDLGTVASLASTQIRDYTNWMLLVMLLGLAGELVFGNLNLHRLHSEKRELR